MKEILLLTISGHDHPGVTAAFTQVLSRHAVNILDIGQSVIHDRLNLGMLLEVPEEELAATREVVREAMEQVHALEVPLVVDAKSGRNWRDVA